MEAMAQRTQHPLVTRWLSGTFLSENKGDVGSASATAHDHSVLSRLATFSGQAVVTQPVGKLS